MKITLQRYVWTLKPCEASRSHVEEKNRNSYLDWSTIFENKCRVSGADFAKTPSHRISTFACEYQCGKYELIFWKRFSPFGLSTQSNHYFRYHVSSILDYMFSTTFLLPSFMPHVPVWSENALIIGLTILHDL